MVSLMIIHQHIISQSPGKGCGDSFSSFSNSPINSNEILRQQGQDPLFPMHGRERGVSLCSSLQRVQRYLQDPRFWAVLVAQHQQHRGVRAPCDPLHTAGDLTDTFNPEAGVPHRFNDILIIHLNINCRSFSSVSFHRQALG